MAWHRRRDHRVVAVKSILDKSFKYRDSANTDIRKTFERIRREQEAKKRAEQQHRIISISRKRA